MKTNTIISNEEFEAEYLKAEWYKDYYDPYREKYTEIVLKPDLNNLHENEIRKQLLWGPRHPLLQQLPSDVVWHDVEITSQEFSEILVIKEFGWEKTFLNHKKLSDAVRFMESGDAVDHGVKFNIVNDIKSSIGKYDFSERLICIALSTDGPFTLIEGNHRALAFELEKQDSGKTDHLPSRIIVGVSSYMGQAYWLNYI